MPQLIQCMLVADRIERLSDGFNQRLVRANLRFTQSVLYLGAGLFFRREIRRMRR
jgi:hypothetical protein